MKLTSIYTEEQQKQITQTEARFSLIGVEVLPIGTPIHETVKDFHTAVGIQTPDHYIVPAVSARYRRGKLILEEFLELLEAMGFKLCVNPAAGNPLLIDNEFVDIHHVEQSRYDIVETADALGDLNVVVNGTALEFGIPIEQVNHEIYCSNMTKLQADGTPIVNHCKACGFDPENKFTPECDCESDVNFLKPGAPLGKILKPEGFVPANIAAVLWHNADAKEVYT